MNDRTRQYLRDALDEATALQVDLAQANLQTFSQSRQLQRITERSLEIIGEAIRRALDEDASLEATSDDIRDWIWLRNVISHQYDNLLPEILWVAATVEFPDLIEQLEILTT